MTTLYLSRLALDPRQRVVQRDLADCYAMHQRILSGFPDGSIEDNARERFGVLYRIESPRQGPAALVQSRVVPDWSRLPVGYLAQPALVKPLDAAYAALREGTTLLFRLRANVVKRISNRNTTQAERWRGKRVELRREADQLAWLGRKGDEAGFRLITVRAHPGLSDAPEAGREDSPAVSDARVELGGIAHGSRREAGGVTHTISFGGITFEGRLVVTDAVRFRSALELGLGPAKAFGFGLLSVAPVPTTGN
jgi:CRISPR system Cascade subunit CasE